MPQNRREFLKLCAASASAAGICSGLPTLASGASSGSASSSLKANLLDPATLTRYVDPLPRLAYHAPSARTPHSDTFHIRMQPCAHRLHSSLPPTRLWGYEGQYPGPVLEAVSGRLTEVTWENQLPTTHLFKVDPNVPGAGPPAPAVRTVPHLHGSRTPPFSDGLPENWFVPGKSVVYRYPNQQRAATLWYHDHAMGITRLNSYAGLSGFYLLRDDYESSLRLPGGDYEIPIVLHDRLLDPQGQLVYQPSDETGAPLPPGVWGPEFFGNLPVINGSIWPFLEVEPTCYRLRLLNGSNSRFYRLSLNRAQKPTDPPQLLHFHQIGTDGGLLGSPAKLTSLLLSPAERADLLVDFSQAQGETIMVGNNAASPFPGWSTLGQLHAPLNELMQIRVRRTAASVSVPPLPQLVPLQFVPESKASVTRDIVLSEQMRPPKMLIDGKGYAATATEKPLLNAVEIWRFANTTEDAHSMHLHLVQFQVLYRQGYDQYLLATHGTLRLTGKPRLPEANENGWKDTAIVYPREALVILVQFSGYTGKYVYHCHMLEHEDNDMMRPFEVVDFSAHCADPQPSSPLSALRAGTG